MLENCFQCPRFLGKNACKHKSIEGRKGENQVSKGSGRKITDLDDEERLFFDGLEELAQDEADERDEVLVRLLAREALFFGHDLLEQVQGGYHEVQPFGFLPDDLAVHEAE